MHHRMGSRTLLQLAFPRESNLNFPGAKSKWNNTIVKEEKNKKKEKNMEVLLYMC